MGQEFFLMQNLIIWICQLRRGGRGLRRLHRGGDVKVVETGNRIGGFVFFFLIG